MDVNLAVWTIAAQAYQPDRHRRCTSPFLAHAGFCPITLFRLCTAINRPRKTERERERAKQIGSIKLTLSGHRLLQRWPDLLCLLRRCFHNYLGHTSRKSILSCGAARRPMHPQDIFSKVVTYVSPRLEPMQENSSTQNDQKWFEGVFVLYRVV